MPRILRIATHPALQCAWVVGFLILALHYRFVLPRYDYWDVVYDSTFIIENGVLDLAALNTFLLAPQADQLMIISRGAVFLTNHLAGPHVIVLEIVVGWALLIVAYLLLLSLLHLPPVGRQNLDLKGGLKLLFVFLLFWWPASLPSLTNHWFAIQYGLVLATGLGSMSLLVGNRQTLPRLLAGCALFLFCALSHGTGLLLGPVLAAWLGIRRRAPVWVVAFLAATSLALLAVVWLQHEQARFAQAGFAIEHIKFLARIITPPFWEQALFVLVLLPLLMVAIRGYVKRSEQLAANGAGVILLWGLLVWLATFVARYGFQDHANPHYLRFNVLFYIALSVTFIDTLKQVGRKGYVWVPCVVFGLIWVKGFDSGISMSRIHHAENLAGYASLVEDVAVENPSTEYLYPPRNHRLTRVLIPHLIRYRSYGYREMLEQ